MGSIPVEVLISAATVLIFFAFFGFANRPPSWGLGPKITNATDHVSVPRVLALETSIQGVFDLPLKGLGILTRALVFFAVAAWPAETLQTIANTPFSQLTLNMLIGATWRSLLVLVASFWWLSFKDVNHKAWGKFGFVLAAVGAVLFLAVKGV